ncbi:hypothetical protein GH714_035768 [Hevea brasiliensis]|uniref:HP domain-containing protein n=1 Tax=Hevea brasiliensis TaxID=3981 RepID=A0A6A6KKD8_HEVBR|nr:hypothetical protein GH714_035768 [Hevea brasiliensis]
MSSSTKALDPAFQGVGQRPGTEIWRIENFQPVPLPKSDYGKFYMGDSYIVLQTTSGKGGAYLYDVHFWIGKDTSQDEAGTAAIKTVELDAVLGGRAVQHREIQGHESDKFLSYFKPCIIPLEGGVASGFKKPEEEVFETRLYVCRGKRVVRMKQVPFARASLNHDDVFILDAEKKIYQFNGANSNIQERAKALEVIQFLKEKYHEGTCDVAIVDDGKLDTESDSGEFWVLFGGFAPIGKKVISEDDIVPETTPAKLYSISNGEAKVVEGEPSKGLLENNKCYLLDCGADVFVWVGRVTQVEERKAASQAAEEFVVSQNRPKSTRITRVIQGYETHSFKSNFDSWPAGSAAPGAEEGRGKVAALLKQQGVGVKGMAKSAPVNEEVPPLLEGVERWRYGASMVAQRLHCLRMILVNFIVGIAISYFTPITQEDQKIAVRLANTMSNSLKGRPVQGRIFQGKEPPQFIALCQPMAVLKGGLSSGYKKYIEEKGLTDETYTSDCVALFRISGTSVHNNKAVQVDAVATSLNSTECFLLQSGSSVFTWHGNQSTFEQQQLSAKIAEFLKPGVALKHAKEGTESSAFWFALGGKQSYTSKKASPEISRDPHLFTFSFNKDPKEKQNAFDVGQKYIEVAASLEGLAPNVPLYKVTEGNEPSFFTTYFSWDPTKAMVSGNSFQKKAALLFGVGHHAVEDKSNGNQGGPTQRASALAALSTAFNLLGNHPLHFFMMLCISIFMHHGQYSSNGSNQGATQRASALAALNSAFSSSSGPKVTASRTSGPSQGSQRAAAVAALSSVLTAEKKKTPETSPSRTEGKSDNSLSEVEGSEEVAEVKETEEVASVSESIAEDSEPKQDTEPDENGNGSSESTFSYDQLKAHSDNPVTGIDFKRRECAYLSEDDFQTVFGMTKDAFYKLPKWKQDVQKKKVDLF